MRHSRRTTTLGRAYVGAALCSLQWPGQGEVVVPPAPGAGVAGSAGAASSVPVAGAVPVSVPSAGAGSIVAGAGSGAVAAGSVVVAVGSVAVSSTTLSERSMLKTTAAIITAANTRSTIHMLLWDVRMSGARRPSVWGGVALGGRSVISYSFLSQGTSSPSNRGLPK
jgi:hypothetical protein